MDLKPRCKHFRCRYGEYIGEVPTDTECLVDTKGYIPLSKQVERAILAGERLEQFRRGFYDYEPNKNGEYVGSDEDLEPSPLLSPNLDPSVDVPLIKRQNDEKLKRVVVASKLAKEQAKQSEAVAKEQNDDATNTQAER